MKSWYNVHGLSLIIEADPPELSWAIDQHVAAFAAKAFLMHDYSICIVRGLAETTPDGVEIVSHGEILPGVPSRFAVHGERSWLVVPGRFAIISDPEKRTTTIHIGEECDRRLQAIAAIQAIDAALANSGQHIVHGAALAMPGDPLCALLIFAPSGCGKTTTALALALAGFPLATDDAIVLLPRPAQPGEGIGMWGLPRSLKVHRRTAELLPAVARQLGPDWDDQGEQPLTLAALDRVARTIPVRAMPVAAIVVLREWSSAREHALAPLDKSSALLHMVQDNIRRTPFGVLSASARRFARLAELVTTTPTFELCVGADIARLPGIVASGLRRHLPQYSSEATDAGQPS